MSIKICHHSTDGFGHQLEGIIRLVSLSLNNENIDYVYNFKKNFSFEHSNFNLTQLNLYLLKALEILHSKHGKTLMYNSIMYYFFTIF